MTHPYQDPKALLGQQYPSPGAGGGGSPFGQPSSTQRTEPLAIIALCLAVSGLATGGVSSVAGAILGAQARAKIRSEPNLTGDGMAKAAVVVGWIIGGLVITYVLILFIAVFLIAVGAAAH